MDALFGAGSRSWTNDRGSLTTASPALCVYVTRVVGHMDETIATQVIAGGNEVVARSGKLVGFHDWSGVRSYDTEARTKLTEWGYAIRNEVERVHILVGTKIVRMGVAVASIVLLGMLVPYDDPKAFEDALRKTIEEKRLPPKRTTPPARG